MFGYGGLVETYLLEYEKRQWLVYRYLRHNYGERYRRTLAVQVRVDQAALMLNMLEAKFGLASEWPPGP